jgi:uncharacterized protein YjbI with pentapeptide repeats
MFHIRTNDQLQTHLAQKGDLSMTTLENLDLDVSAVPSLADASLRGCRFSQGSEMPADLSEAIFVDCTMPQSRFRSASLYGARFVRCDLSGSEFQGCDLSAATFIDCRWDGVTLQDCDVDATQLPVVSA